MHFNGMNDIKVIYEDRMKMTKMEYLQYAYLLAAARNTRVEAHESNVKTNDQDQNR